MYKQTIGRKSRKLAKLKTESKHSMWSIWMKKSQKPVYVFSLSLSRPSLCPKAMRIFIRENMTVTQSREKLLQSILHRIDLKALILATIQVQSPPKQKRVYVKASPNTWN
jgi:hypothetical protein